MLIFSDGQPFGFEFKCSDAPGVTRSMRAALNDLNLRRLFIIYPGDDSFPLDDRIQVVSVSKLGHILSEGIRK
ncbi:hypothetical protein QUF80_23035 [Desulfococcaceae bacterium HSG8]|nr:hypothetical protein [Desulfococcaceae bacterium HSG8]